MGRGKTPPPDAEEKPFLQRPQAAFFRVPSKKQSSWQSTQA